MLKQLSRLLAGSSKKPPVEHAQSKVLPMGDLDLIVPMIKAISGGNTKAPMSEIRLPFEQSPASMSLAADMVVMYAIDRPSHLEYISNEVASATGLTVEELHRRSVKNLPSRLGNVQLHDCGEGVYGLSAGGTFEASLLLVDDLWSQLADRLPGDILAAIPSRDLLFVLGLTCPGFSNH